jgi:pSer/pThr/pTyr-binding forkhead associated (FHA) protein
VLPGRLEVLAGLTLDNPWEQEIRFVQVPGSEPEITLGRGEGPPHRHLRLDSATVSRQQAHMRFGEGGWTLTNLSQTNPTSVNGEALAPGGAAVLREGDRIEMGEVAFRFRER